MSQAYDNEQTLQQKIMNGANILADNVASTLGPRGRNVLLKEKGGKPFVTKDGVTVAAFVSLDDPFEDAAAQIIKQAAVETNNNAGDGTTTATVLARAIIREAQRYIASGMSPVEIQRGIHLGTKTIIDNLKEMATPITSIDDIKHIATISANNDSVIGELIALAIDRIGQDGAITIEESRSMDTSIDIIEGFKFNSGYSAGAFVTDDRRAMMYHEEPLFMVTDHKISGVEQILPVLELCARESRPLIIIAEEIEGQALAALIMNAMRGTLKVAAIKAPSYGEERRNTLEDIAASTGATFLSRASGTKLQDTKMIHLGTAKFIECTKYTTTIVGGQQDYEAIESRIMNLKAVIEQTESMEECESIQGRITRLNSGVAVIRVGGSTEVEMIEKKHRIEDALEAVRAAQEEGVVSGGGCALARAASKMIITTVGEGGDFHPDQVSGINIVMKACQEPLRQMSLNSGESPDLILDEVLRAKSPNGWDFRRGEMVNLIDKGIIDPVKVTRIALQNAASCAGTLLTTNFGIIQREEG
jgi:chaperonin GroEL